MACRKSYISTMDISTFDGRLDYSGHLSNSQFFLDWLHSVDRYFTWYSLSYMEKIRFAITKLTKQASQYVTDVVKRRVFRGQEPIDAWSYMKDELKGVPPYFYNIFLTDGAELCKTTNPPKNMLTNLTSFLL